MDVAHAIVKVYVTERNDVIKPHSNAITIWRTSAIEVTALLKKLRSEMKGVQEKTRGRGVGGVTEMILNLVWVCEPVLRNLP